MHPRLVNTAILLGSWILLSTVALAQNAGPPKSGVLRGIVIASDASDAPATLRARLIDRGAGGPWLGLQLDSVSPALRAQLGLKQERCVLVTRVMANSPAAEVGIEQYDVVATISMGSRHFDDLPAAVSAASKAGASLQLEIIRGGKRQAIEVKPAPRDRSAARYLLIERGDRGIATVVEQPGQNIKTFRIERDGNNITALRVVGDALVEFSTEPPPLRVFADAPIAEGTQSAAQTSGNRSITINRVNGQAAQITVLQGTKKHHVTERQLGQLPADLREAVQQLLRGVTARAPQLEERKPPRPPEPPQSPAKDGEASRQPVYSYIVRPRKTEPPPAPDKVLTEILRRLEHLQQSVEVLQQQVGQPAAKPAPE